MARAASRSAYFNTKKVRLKLEIRRATTVEYEEFQYQKGAIKTP